MSIAIGAPPPPLHPGVVDKLLAVSIPTIGHYVEGAAMDVGIRAAVFPAKFVGRAVTVRIVSPDSALVHKAVALLTTADVLVIDMGGDVRHAPVGEVVTLAAAMRGAAAIVIDGPCTDIVELGLLRLPVFSRGTSSLTTKLLGLGEGGINVAVSCGGVAVNPGDIVVGDENGILVLEPSAALSLAETARLDDLEEPALREALRAGAVLPDETGVSAMLKDRYGV